MPKKTSTLKLAGNYPALVKQVNAELEGLEKLLKQKTVQAYWNIGKYIHEHILENAKRAQYGTVVFAKLSEDVRRDVSTLKRSLKFYRTYPQIGARGHLLSWSLYRQLITVPDSQKRKEIEKQIVKKKWDGPKLQNYLNFQKSQTAAKNDPQEPIESLAFKRGMLLTYGVAENPKTPGGVLLDLGFRIRMTFTNPKAFKPAKGDFLRTEDSGGFEKVMTARDEIFTYKAEVIKVIDGDTLTALIELGFGLAIEQKLRLRGIDCPEIDTEEGLKAKRHVQSQLNQCGFIVVKTHKDTTDKYDRYLADIFYLPEEKDPQAVAETGAFLNQELLDNSLARVF